VENEILLLTDYRNQFYESVRSRGESLNLELIGRYLAEMGYTLRVMQFCDVEFQPGYFKNRNILYQSSEDKGLFYKDYIEDILLGLTLQGANLIPDFPKFRAHHNKSFMEILRKNTECLSINIIKSNCY
jgi:hypothetical protein